MATAELLPSVTTPYSKPVEEAPASPSLSLDAIVCGIPYSEILSEVFIWIAENTSERKREGRKKLAVRLFPIILNFFIAYARFLDTCRPVVERDVGSISGDLVDRVLLLNFKTYCRGQELYDTLFRQIVGRNPSPCRRDDRKWNKIIPLAGIILRTMDVYLNLPPHAGYFPERIPTFPPEAD